ncbi:uncharacterized protein [Nyctibius grandis]|uniref:uncharacterized protein isoform X3 n=1 Tax=Nyctibius grandis TaxID=48427 RepID=UPI0035BC3573
MFLQPSEVVMAGEIVYADLRHPGDGVSPAEKHHAPALCPRWHGVLLKASGLGHLVLLVLVVVLSVQASDAQRSPARRRDPGKEPHGAMRVGIPDMVFLQAPEGQPHSWCWLQAVSPGLASLQGQMLPALQGKGELDRRQERLRKSGVSPGSAPGRGREGVHQDHHRWRPAAGVDRINIIPQELDMGGQHIPQRQNIWHPAEDGRRVLDTER